MRLKKIVLFLSSLALLTVGVAVAFVYWQGESDVINDKRVAVVFGNKVNVDGSLSPRLRARLDAAYALYNKGVVATFFVSGAVGREGHDEAVAMKRYLETKSIPSSVVIADSNGFTSAHTTRNARRMLGDVPVVAVTQRYHLYRAKVSLKNAGFHDVKGYASAYSEWRDVYAYLREIPAIALYMVRD